MRPRSFLMMATPAVAAATPLGSQLASSFPVSSLQMKKKIAGSCAATALLR